MVTHFKLLPALHGGTDRSSLLLSKELWIITLSEAVILHTLFIEEGTRKSQKCLKCSQFGSLQLSEFPEARASPFACSPFTLWLFKHMDRELLTFTGKTNKITLKQERSDVSLQLAPLVCGNLISASGRATWKSAHNQIKKWYQNINLMAKNSTFKQLK